MSYQSFFEQTEAVAKVLDEWVKGTPATEFLGADSDSWVADKEEFFTAVWQAVELLSRAYTALLPIVQAEAAKVALVLPDVQVRKGTLYGPDGAEL